MKKNTTTLLAFVILCIGLLLVVVITIKEKARENGFSDEYIMTDEIAPLLSFTYYSDEEWKKQLKDISSGKVSYHELEALLKYMGIQEYVTYEPGAGFQNITREEFFYVYRQIVDLLDVDGRVVEEDRIFLGKQAIENKWLTHKGYETIKGGLAYLKQYDMYHVYTFDGAILGIEKQTDSAIRWENVFVHTTAEGKGQILFEKEIITIDFPVLEENISDTICDLEWKNKQISAIYKKEDTIRGTVLSYDDDKIEISGYGTLEHDGDLKIYKTYGTLEQLDESKLVIGNLMADFVVAEKRVCGIILKESAELRQIRVLLLNGNEPYYPDIYVKTNNGATVTFKETEKTLDANGMIKASEYWEKDSEGYIKISPTTNRGELFLTDENGDIQSLGYEGEFEIRKYPEGYCIVNELSLEDYLCAVVPSEMPASYEQEALRAQAICARSYACIQLGQDGYSALGANVDDSTAYQVYNKQERDERTTLAVRDTIGEVLKYQGNIVEAYYYSTSCGFSQNIDVWNYSENSKQGYVEGSSLLTEDSSYDFSDEDVFAEFIKNNTQNAYDSDAPYYRWKAELDTEERLEMLNEEVVKRKNAKSENIQVFEKDGSPSEKEISDLGEITKITVEERSAGGVLKKIRISYEEGSVLVITEYNIRKILGSAVVSMTDKNEKEIQSMSMLPSAAFTIVPLEKGFVLYGGGYGHGIGLSQNGANGMAKAGFTYVDILQKAYKNISIENIYNNQIEAQ